MPHLLFSVPAQVACLMLACWSLAQAPTATDSARTPLATRQEIIRDRVQRLEDQMYRMIQNLKATEPGQARRLEKALAGMGELGIRADLKNLIGLLNANRLDLAADEQVKFLARVLRDLDAHPGPAELGLVFYEDFFELSGNWPAWLSLFVQSQTI